ARSRLGSCIESSPIRMPRSAGIFGSSTRAVKTTAMLHVASSRSIYLSLLRRFFSGLRPDGDSPNHALQRTCFARRWAQTIGAQGKTDQRRALKKGVGGLSRVLAGR